MSADPCSIPGGVPGINVPAPPEPFLAPGSPAPAGLRFLRYAFHLTPSCSKISMAFGCPSVTLATLVLCPLTQWTHGNLLYLSNQTPDSCSPYSFLSLAAWSPLPLTKPTSPPSRLFIEAFPEGLSPLEFHVFHRNNFNNCCHMDTLLLRWPVSLFFSVRVFRIETTLWLLHTPHHGA